MVCCGCYLWLVSLNCVSFYVHPLCAYCRCLRISDFCASALFFVCVILLHTYPWDPLGLTLLDMPPCMSLCLLACCLKESTSAYIGVVDHCVFHVYFCESACLYVF